VSIVEGDIVPRPKTPIRKFRAWNEGWERMQFKSSGCDLFAAKFSEKYGGLRFKDVDKDGRVGYTLKDNCAVLQKCYKGKGQRTEILPQKGFGWYYALLVCYDGYDADQFYHQQSNELWELFELPAFDDFMRWLRSIMRERMRFRCSRRVNVMSMMLGIGSCLLMV